MGKLMKRGVAMIVTLVAIILIIMIGVTVGGRTKITTSENIVGNTIIPIQKVFYKSGRIIEGGFHSLFAFKAVAKENELLKKENEELNKKMIQLSLARDELNELRSLKKALNYLETEDTYHYITASVTGMDLGNWFNIFSIDVGKKQGIEKGYTVINGRGLIGKVYEAGDHWAKVVTIIDNKSSVSFEVLRNSQYIGVIRGSMEGELTGYLVDPQAEVLVGDKIITSGLSIYPKGIPIGQIKKVTKKKDELLKTISIEPMVNFKKIDKVIVMIPDKSN